MHIRSHKINDTFFQPLFNLATFCIKQTALKRANTLATWCMFAQVFPLFQDASVFTTIPVLYADGFMDAAIRPTLVNPVPQGVISIASLAINVLALALIIKRSKEQKKNPYKQEIFTDTKDFQLAMARAED